jgi:hypothetical protein
MKLGTCRGWRQSGTRECLVLHEVHVGLSLDPQYLFTLFTRSNTVPQILSNDTNLPGGQEDGDSLHSSLAGDTT